MKHEVEFLEWFFTVFPDCEFVDEESAERYRDLLLEHYREEA